MGTLRKITVKCDEPSCDWSEETTLPKAVGWLKKACPSCGCGEIISNRDIEYINAIKEITDTQDLIDPNEKLSYIDVTIDTSGLRE